MAQPRSGSGGKVVAFKPGLVRARDNRDSDERGKILLFTGIRYERFPDHASFLAATGRSFGPVAEDRARS